MEENDNLFDITQEGPATYRDLQKANNGVFMKNFYGNEYNDFIGEDGNLISNDEIRQKRSESVGRRLSELKNVSLSDWYNLGIPSGDKSEYFNSNTTSKYDDAVTYYKNFQDIDDIRASQQSGGRQIVNGLGKMAVTALTTALDSYAGTIYGIFNIGKEAVQGNINSGSDAVDAFVRNPVSRSILYLNDAAEQWMPNYYSEYEKNAPWYQQFWHANFIGDHLLKNTGFMLGAYLSSKASSKWLSKAFKLNEARNVYKNTALAAGVGDKSEKAVLNAYKSGKSIGTVDKVSESLAQAAKNSRNADLYTKLASTAIGSVGESRMEAITNSNDWFERNKQTIDGIASQQLQSLEEDIFKENPDWFSVMPIYDDRGNIVGYKPVVENEFEYNAEYNRRRKEIQDKQNGALAELTRQRIDYSNASFGINFILTYGENLNIFGDAITGSWSKRSMFNKQIKNSIVDGKTVWSKKPGIKAWNITKGVLRGPVAEGTQEMLQQATTTHLNRRAGNRLNSYYGDVIDQDGLDYVTGSFKNFMASIKDTYANADDWENFALGAVTALLPLPTKVHTQNKQNVQRDENGNPIKQSKIDQFTSKWTVGGELWESIMETREQGKQVDELVKALNDLENDPNRMNQFYDIVKQSKLNEIQQNALDNGDEKTYKDIDIEKLASTIMTYSDAGQIDYLIQQIEEAYTIETPEQIEQLRQMLSYKQNEGNKEVEKSLFDGMSDRQIVDYFKNQKEQIIDKVKKYSKIYNNINDLYGDFGGGNVSREYIKTLALDIINVDDRERRIKDISKKKLDQIKQYAQKFKSGIDMQNLTEEQSAQLKEIDEAIETLTSINNLDIAFSDQGFLNQLDNIRSQQLQSLQDEYKHVQKLLDRAQKRAQKKYNTGQSREEYDKFRKGTSRAKTRVNDRLKQLKALDGRIGFINNNIAETNQGIDFGKSMQDLFSLLEEREDLYNTLAVLSGQGGIDMFFEGLREDIGLFVNDFQKNYSKKFYDKFKQSKNINDIPNGLGNLIRTIAREDNDESTVGYIDLYDKYITGQNSLVNNNQLQRRQSQDLRDQITSIISQSTNPQQAQEKINEYFKSITDGNIKQIVDQFENNLRKQKEQKKKTDSGIAKDDPKDKEAKPIDEKYKIPFGKVTEQAIDNFLSNIIMPMVDSGFKFTPAMDGLKEAIADQLGYDPDDGQTIDQFLQSVLSGDGGRDAIMTALREIHSSVRSEQKQQSGRPKLVQGEEEPEEQEQENPEQEQPQQTTPGVVSSDDAIKGQKDVVSTVASTLDENDVDENNKEINPERPTELREEAEIIQEQPYKPIGSTDPDDDIEEDGIGADSWNVNQLTAAYRFSSIRDRANRVLQIFDRNKHLDHPNVVEYSIFCKKMNELFKVQEFLDSGFLNRIVEKNGQKSNTKIRFVGIDDMGIVDYNGDKNEKIVRAFMKKTVFAAVEIPQQLRKSYDKMGFKTTQFVDSNGKVVNLQVLGAVTPNFIRVAGTSSMYKVDDEGREIPGKIWADDQFTQLEDALQAQRSKFSNSANYIAYDTYTTIASLFPGRMVKQIENGVGLGERNVSEILTEDQRIDPEGELQIRLYLDNKGNFIDIGDRLGDNVIPLNVYSMSNQEAVSSGRNRGGSVWIMTKEADGNVYHKGARLVDFNRDWYDLHSENGNPYLDAIKDIVNKISQVNSEADAKRLLHDLHSYLYIPEGKSMFIDLNSGYFRIGQQNVALRNIDGIMDMILGQEYKFSIGGTTLKDIVNSDIITTDLAMLHNANSSFAINKVVFNENGQTIQESQFFQENDIRGLATDSSNASQNNGNNYNVSLVGQKSIEYRLYNDGRVQRIDNGEFITSQDAVEFMKSVRAAENVAIESVKQFDGRKKIYMNYYIDNDGKMKYVAFAYQKTNGRVDVVRITDPNQIAVIRRAYLGEDITGKYSDIVEQINRISGNKTVSNDKQQLKQAVKEDKGVVEKPQVRQEQIVPKYVKDYPDLQNVYFNIGDSVVVKINDKIYNCVVNNIDDEGNVVVGILENQSVMLNENNVLDFFGKKQSNGRITVMSKSVSSDINNGIVTREYFNADKNESTTMESQDKPKKKRTVLPTLKKPIDPFAWTNQYPEQSRQLIKDLHNVDLFTQDQYRQLLSLWSPYGTGRNFYEAVSKVYDRVKDSFEKFKESGSQDDFDKFFNLLKELTKCP